MILQMPDYEQLRLSYKPAEVKVLLVGESRPESGLFFYSANSPMTKYTQWALAQVYDEARFLWGTDFLEFFRSKGFYLEDLCTEAVNGKKNSERQTMWRQGVPDLSRKIAEWRPKAVIGVLRSTLECVMAAVQQSGVEPLEFKAVPFPGNGWQHAYVSGVAEFLKGLRAKGVL